MLNIFFDLDLTLIIRRDIDQVLSGVQLDYLSSQTSNLTVNGSQSFNGVDIVFSPLYQQLHQQLFLNLVLAGSRARFHFITAGSYEQSPTCLALNTFFSNSDRRVQRAINSSDFINRSFLDGLIGRKLDDFEGDPEERNDKLVEALAVAKADYIERVLMSQSVKTRNNMILIDDSEANREIAVKRGFQVINPTDDTYPIIIRTLASAISGDYSFYSFHNHEIKKEILFYNQEADIYT
ncbi:hypothetical protein [Pelagibaculum spongiae]|uniref:FCP1 homology domain-containing protein n=1 Tax=Pelagibaculum spongiae TaxID=2080658 RepID=A0A2V1H4L6_9GAMM|nr:hypothetical protein [Pelagibaculum spongiae]PVZ71715.1 hypothetical protein DC094_01425 [Pelagibaculum spongiae]